MCLSRDRQWHVQETLGRGDKNTEKVRKEQESRGRTEKQRGEEVIKTWER